MDRHLVGGPLVPPARSRLSVPTVTMPGGRRELGVISAEPGTRDVMDAITLLKNDHRRVEKLFASFERTGKRAKKTRRRIVDRMAADLSMHTTLEEQFFYPLVRQAVPDADSVILEGLEEHHVVKLLLKELAKASPGDEQFAPKVTVLIQAVRQHVQREERDVFPAMRKSVGRARINEIGDAMRKLQRKARGASPKATRKAARKTLKRVA
jgi:hemerythrin superfamily protein